MRRILVVIGLTLLAAGLVPAGTASAAPAIGELRSNWNPLRPENFLCLHVDENDSGTPVQALPCNLSSQQRFTADVGAIATLRVHSRCIDVAGAATHNGARVQLWSCNNTDAQKWEFVHATGTSFFMIRNPRSGFCLTANNDGAVISDCNPIFFPESVRAANLFRLAAQIF